MTLRRLESHDQRDQPVSQPLDSRKCEICGKGTGAITPFNRKLTGVDYAHPECLRRKGEANSLPQENPLARLALSYLQASTGLEVTEILKNKAWTPLRRSPMKASEVLRAGLAKLDDGKKWIKFAYGDAERGYCCSGVLGGGGNVDSPEYQYLARGGEIKTGVCNWNDAPERTYADVEAAFQKAIALAEAEGN
jgi:hypothetical protein